MSFIRFSLRNTPNGSTIQLSPLREEKNRKKSCAQRTQKSSSDLRDCRNVSVMLSPKEFQQAASKYDSTTCNIRISSNNFNQINGEMVAFISISRSDFQGDKTVILPLNASATNIEIQEYSDDQKNRYTFRSRKRKQVFSSCPPAKRSRDSRALVVQNVVKPKLIVAKKEELREGLLVLAKMKTYSEWPARILAFGKTYVDVYFFGDESTGHVPYENVGILNENHHVIRDNLQKSIRGYVQAVTHFERVLKIPTNFSLLNEN